MKNYNEMAKDVLCRIGEYETKQLKRRKALNRVFIPVCAACFVAIIGIGLWQIDIWGNKPPIDLEDSTHIGEKDWVDDKDGSGDNNDIDGDFTPNGEVASPNSSNNSASSESNDTTNDNDLIDVIGMVKVDGISYVQCSTNTKLYTPDKYLGEAYDFEGTYQTHLSDVASGLYIAKEDPDVLMVELKHGEYVDYVILIKEETTDKK